MRGEAKSNIEQLESASAAGKRRRRRHRRRRRRDVTCSLSGRP